MTFQTPTPTPQATATPESLSMPTSQVMSPSLYSSADGNESIASLCSISCGSASSGDDSSSDADSNQGDDIVPDRFICPLTLDVMKEPMYSRYGHNFERKAILQWLSKEAACPLTRKPLGLSCVIRNHRLQKEIDDWKAEQKETGKDLAGNSSSDDEDDEEEDEVPAEFVCPLTNEIMKFPIMTRYGDNMERSAIVRWLNSGNAFCPIHCKPLLPRDILPNRALQHRIHAWRLVHGMAQPGGDEDDEHDFSATSFTNPYTAASINTTSGQLTPETEAMLVQVFNSTAVSDLASTTAPTPTSSSSSSRRHRQRRRTQESGSSADAAATSGKTSIRRALRARLFGKS